MSQGDTFHDLLRRVRDRDEPAVTELVRAFEDEVRRGVRKLLGDSALRRRFDSLDIVQAVLLRFCLGLAEGELRVESPVQLIALLNKMAFNRFLDQVRHETAQERDVYKVASDDLDAIAPEQPGVSTVVGWRDEFAEVHRRLTDAERTLARRWASGESWAEIAGAGRAEQDRCRHKLDAAFTRVAGQLTKLRKEEVAPRYLEAVYRWVLEQSDDGPRA
jgi:DNA-directed RNA polymerase specialized sigma24 family protein